MERIPVLDNCYPFTIPTKSRENNASQHLGCASSLVLEVHRKKSQPLVPSPGVHRLTRLDKDELAIRLLDSKQLPAPIIAASRPRGASVPMLMTARYAPESHRAVHSRPRHERGQTRPKYLWKCYRSPESVVGLI